MREESSGGVALGGPEEQYALLMECVADYAIFLMNADGRVAAWNLGAERLFGYREKEALGLPFDRFFVPEDVERGVPQKELRAAVQHGRAGDDKWHLRKDGTRFWVSGSTTALRDDDGNLRGFAKVTRDRTEQREAQRRREEFLAVLAHELRGPLAPVRNAVEVLRLAGPSGGQAGAAREMIERQVAHMTRLVDDLLDVTRVTQGKVTLKKERVEVATVVAQAVEAVRPLVDARRQTLDVALEPALRVEADPTRLAQVVTNLLTNASKYSPEGAGRIRVEADGAPGLPAGPGGVTLVVSDNGMGISAEMLPRVFDLFMQADRAVQQSQGGLGVGLTLVKRLVELHGGAVEARSEGPGRGSEFVVRLPAAEVPAPAPSAPSRHAADAPAVRRRVLVVDDNADAADSLATLLRMKGHEVRSVHEGAAVLEAARAFAPDVVLLDIGLPGALTGYDLAPRLRQLPGLESVLLVALTGYGQEEDRRRAADAGFDAHLVKPANFDELQALLVHGRAR
jgi:PAS domain S-box-containing protein